MELNEMEKKLLFQVEGDYQTKILNELYMTVRYSNNSEQREAAEGLMAKLRVLSNAECMDLVKDIQKNYRLPYGLVDAVHALVGGEIPQEPAYRSTAEIQVSKEPEKKTFALPWARRCATAAVFYLQKRGISSEVIRQCLQAGIFYEARYHGEPVCYPPQSPGSRHVAVFEAPIDALSHATLQELEGWKWNGYRLSLGGTSHVALTSFLERHPEIRRVTLYMDHDLAGFVNARKIKTMLHEDKRFRHIRVSVNPPRMGKDYNEKLLLVREQLQTSQHQRRPKEAAVSIYSEGGVCHGDLYGICSKTGRIRQ